MEVKEFLTSHAKLASKFNAIVPESYAKFNVKRGLRNDDGTGVLVGLTEVGEVHGYVIDEQEKKPAEGRLRYRGVDVYDLVDGFQKEKRFGFEESTYLLMFGKLPNATELTEFNKILGKLRNFEKGFAEDFIIRQPSRDLMNKLGSAVLSLYTLDPEPENYSTENLLKQSLELIARFPALVAYCYQSKRRFFDGESMHLHSPKPEYGTAENFLRMIRPSGEFNKLEAEILDLALVLHAEHGGGNNSAFTVRVVSSSYTDTYSAISAAIGSLKGARHGGANNRVMAMMGDISSNVKKWDDEGEVRNYLSKVIRKEAFDKTGLVYGMGHAIYTLSDPRAILLEKKAAELASAKGEEFAKEFALYKLIEKLTPEVFRDVKKNDKVIAPNVDFFSGFVYKMLGIDPELYTPLFAISRITGWCAHRIEELSGDSRIIRPAYKNVLGKKDYISMKDR